MKKHLFARVLAVVTAMSMLSTTAFAAVALDKNEHIDTDGSLLSHKEEDENGEEFDSYDYYLEDNFVLDQTLVIKDGVDASINLNGYDLVLNEDLEVDTETGEVTVPDDVKKGSVIEVTGEGTKLTVTDGSEEGTGTISGGYKLDDGKGGGVAVSEKASLDLESGTITNNYGAFGGGIYAGSGGTVKVGEDVVVDGNLAWYAGGGIYAGGADTSVIVDGATISDNAATSKTVAGYGGGVVSSGSAELTLNNATITGNQAKGFGGGVLAQGKGNITINGGTISENSTAGMGGGIDATDSGTTITVKGTQITENTAATGGGISVYASASTTIKDATISQNSATAYGGGIYAAWDGSKIDLTNTTVLDNEAEHGGGIFMGGQTEVALDETSKLYNNTANKFADDVYKARNATLKLPSAASMNVTGADGKPVTGWYLDSGDRYGNGTYAYFAQNDAVEGNSYTSILCLKAAHDQYFTLSDGEGNELANVEKGTELDLSTIEKPALEDWGFIGWVLDDEIVETVTVTGDMTLVALWNHVNHNYVGTVITPATCTAAGVMTYICEDCGDTYTGEIAALGHTSGEAVTENEVPAQIGADGSYDEVTYCTECGEEISRETVTIPALVAPVVPDEPGIDIPDIDVPGAEEPDEEEAPAVEETVSIEDESVPLAGIMTLAELLEALRQYVGAADVELPDGFAFAKHTYAQAIYWGLTEGLVADSEEEPFDPDVILTVGLLRAVLDNYVVVYKAEDAVIAVEGDDDELVLDLGERLDAFYAELESNR